MKVYYLAKRGTLFALGADKLWTTNTDDGREFDEALARQTVQDFKNLDTHKRNEYWCE